MFVISPLVCVLFYTTSALSLSLGVTPGKLDFSVRPGGTEVNTLYVINQDNQVSDFEVYVEDGKVEWFTIKPDRFTLGGQEQRVVEIAVAPPITATPQEYDVNICVVSMTPGSALRLGAGVKVLTHVQVTELPIMALQWWIVSAVVLIILIIGAFILWRRRVRYG